MGRRITILILLMIVIMLLNACWSKRELNELSIVSALGIDRDNAGYIVTVQVINPRQIAQQTQDIQAPVTVYSIFGKTIFDALRRLSLESPRRLYYSHLRVVVFGEEMARAGIAKAVDFLLRDHEIRTDFYILVAQGKRAENVLNVLTPVEQIPASMMYFTMDTSQGVWGPTQAVDLEELAEDLTLEGKNAVLTGILIKGSPDTGIGMENIEKTAPPTTLRIGYHAVFKDDRLVGWLDESESRGYNTIIENIHNSVVTIPCQEQGNLSIEITSQKAKMKAVLKNGRPQIEIYSRLEANIGDAECNISLTGGGVQQYIEEELEREVKGYMQAAVTKAQQLESDIFGFGNTLYRAHPEVWKGIGGNWDEEFVKLPVNITVTAKIKGLGLITEPFQSETKE